MGPPKRAGKATVVPVARNTRNRTRLHKTKLITDPAQSTLQLTNQLRGLGLYAAPTLGDGNCLFRALADQLWGSPNGHLKLREEICDWMEIHKDRYEGFVDEDRSFDTHIRCMRIPGTYGGHLELSAFSHLKRRNVKVIQPGLVYVIEWNCGWTSDMNPPTVDMSAVDESTLNERDKRRLRRDKLKLEKPKDVIETPEDSGAVYVAYHDWEHFSSVRNLAGPHTGLPIVVERPEGIAVVPPSPATPKRKGKAPTTPRGKGKGKGAALALAAPVPPPPSATPSTSALDDPILTPSLIPLPPSRSVSPLSRPLSQATTTASTSSAASSSLSLPTPPDTLGRLGRSPKRTFDESEETPQSSPAKRHKRPATDVMDIDEADENTPSLSDDSSRSPTSDTSSALSSPSPSPPPVPEPEPEPPRKPLTRRQRKALGLPRPRAAVLASAKAGTDTRSAGKIIIPGGRRGLRSAGKVEAEAVGGEWQTNGTGRLDVRGFRELKI